MSEMPMRHRGKQPRFFPTAGMDEMMTMMLELSAEIWIVKKRQYVLERVAGDQGIDLSAGIEAYALSEQEEQELEAVREQMITRIMRATEGQFAPTQRLDKGDADAGQNAEAA